MSDDSVERLARLETGLGNLVEELRRLAPKIDDLLNSRGARDEQLSRLQRDMDHSYQRHREHQREHADLDARIDRVEQRFYRVYWMLLGIIALMEFLLRIAPDGWFRTLLGIG